MDSKVSATLARTARVAPGSSSTVARGCPWIPATNGTPSTSRAVPEHWRGGSARPGLCHHERLGAEQPVPGRPVALPSRRNAGICYRTWPRPRAARQGGRGGPTRRLRFEFQELGLSTIECQEREFRYWRAGYIYFGFTASESEIVYVLVALLCRPLAPGSSSAS